MLTVEQFAAGLDHCKIQCVAGFRGLKREIKSFSIVDTPEILTYLCGGEFVVDAGYIMDRQPDMLRDFVQQLNEKGCAAYGLKLHRYFDAVPEALLEQGDACDFPIFILPYELRFCDFAYEIHKNLFEMQMDESHKTMMLYCDMVDALCAYRTPDRLLYDLSLAISGPVLLLNRRFALIGFETQGRFDVPLSDFFILEPGNEILGAAQQQALYLSYREQRFKTHQFTVSYRGRELSCVLVPLEISKDDLNFLIVPEIISPLTQEHYRTLENVASLFNLSLRVNSREPTVAASSFVTQVLLAPDTPPTEILRQCKLSGFDHQRSRVCLNIRLDSYVQLSMSWSYTIGDLLRMLVARLTDNSNYSIYFLEYLNYRILYLFFPDGYSPQEIDAHADEAAECAYSFLSQYEIACHIGVSLCHEEPRHIPTAFQQTIDAMELGCRLFPSEGIHSFSGLQVYHWLSTTMTNGELYQLYENTVAPLQQPDSAGIDYVKILETYIANRYNVTKTATDLHVHRNTMIHQLERIQELVPLDMSAMENILKLQMGLHAMRLLELQR